MTAVVVTGATGFVGQQLVRTLEGKGVEVRGAMRNARRPQDFSVDFESCRDFSELVAGAECVFHCAARVHQMNDAEQDPLPLYRQVNTEGTLALAKCAAEAGVKRFVFLSTVKVGGEHSLPGKPFATSNKECAPEDPYALSKYEAECGLRDIARQTGMEVVILRPPLVYGAGVKANFASMMRWVEKGVPLPLGAIDNCRSLIYLENLVDIMVLSMTHPGAANQTFYISDDEDVSTSELLRAIAKAMGKKSRLLPVPMAWMKRAFTLLGKPQFAERLCSSLQVDISPVKERLSWRPPYSLAEGLKKSREMKS